MKKIKLQTKLILTICSLVLIMAIALASFVVWEMFKPTPNSELAESQSPQSQTQSITKPKPEPEPDTFATVLSIGDIMAHKPQITGAKTSDGYDFTAFFKKTASTFKKADLTVGNLELTFGGEEKGFRGYPSFNTPDELAIAMKKSGIDLLMTANNHSYDTGFDGLKRTAKILKKNNLEYTGTKQKLKEKNYIVKEINNIKIGIANFTYETPGKNSERKYLNGNVLTPEANDYINTFSYQRIDTFYKQAKKIITNMKNDGAEFISFYMHWGEEYQLSANDWQKKIAQKLCDMGVQMIIGGHPHVVQPLELIKSKKTDNTAICIYSLGNAVSNQRRELISASKGYTEDGVIFSYTLKKSEGKVTLEEIDLIPTWVRKYQQNGWKYTIYPIKSLKKATNKYPEIANKLKESYNRTKNLTKESLSECQEYLGCEKTFK